MPSPRTVSSVAELECDADSLWNLVSDFARIDRWSRLTVISIQGAGLGCERTVEMESGVRVTERLLRCDAQNKVLEYEALEPNPFPLRDYRSTIAIQALSPQSCRIHWSGQYLPLEGGDPERSDRLLSRVYEGGIELLRAYFRAAVSR